MGYYTFYECTGLLSAKLPNGLTSLTATFVGCSNLKSVELPQGLKSMRAAFANCTSLAEISLPNSLELIDINSFKECTALKTVTVGTGLQKIESSAFYHCKDLEDFYCYAPILVPAEPDVFDEAIIEYATLHVPDDLLEQYALTAPWSGFATIVGIDGAELSKCENPVIAYVDGKLSVTSATEGAKCITTVSDTSIKTYYDTEIPLTLTYTVTAYATAVGHQNSDVVTATLCWVNAEPETQGLSSDIQQAKGNAVIIQNRGGLVSLSGLEEGTFVSLYGIDGKCSGTATVFGGTAVIGTSIPAGDVVILTFGNQSAKYLMK